MHRVLFVCVLLAGSFPGLILADTFNLVGRVKYPNGDGIGGITVRIVDTATGGQNFSLVTTTNPSGVFQFHGVLGDNYTITPDVPPDFCSGFSPARIVDILNNDSKIDFTGACRPGPVQLVSPLNNSIDVPLDVTLVWRAPGATSYQVYFSNAADPSLWMLSTATSIATPTLAGATTYYWRVRATNETAVWIESEIWNFTTVAAAVPPGYRFVPITPCRIVDTRESESVQPYYRGPLLAAGQTRSFTVSGPLCGVPPTAEALALNATVVPVGDASTRRLNRLVVWPGGGSTQPPATMNLSSDNGRIVADAVITGTGPNGSVYVFASDDTDVIIDVNGYFDRQSGSNGKWFYPLTPCRLADTREPDPLGAGGKFMGAPVEDPGRAIAVGGAACLTNAGPEIVIPQAAAYSLNFTVVPGAFLDYLTAYPAGVAKPYVSTLNSYTGIVVANAAIVPAGTGANEGKINVYTTDETDVIIDANGFFGPQTTTINDQLLNGLSFFPIAPCRAVDTGAVDGPYGGPIFTGPNTRSYAVATDQICGVPATAKALAAVVTVRPVNTVLNGQPFLDFLTAYPTGVAKPWVSTLNSYHGGQVSNAAIVPLGSTGSIDLYVTQTTHVSVDVTGYFQ